MDVAVVGGGIVGVMTAYYLARKGRQRVALLEKGRIAGEQSPRATGAGCVRQVGTRRNLPIMVEANRLWPELQRDTGEDLGLVQSGLTYLGVRPRRTWPGSRRFCRWRATNGVDSRILSGAMR